MVLAAADQYRLLYIRPPQVHGVEWQMMNGESTPTSRTARHIDDVLFTNALVVGEQLPLAPAPDWMVFSYAKRLQKARWMLQNLDQTRTSRGVLVAVSTNLSSSS